MRLVQRREVWLPTIWGWLALFLVAAALGIALVRMLYPFLALNAPVGARVLVVEGWLGSQELDDAAAIFRRGGYERVLTTGGPIPAGADSLPQLSYAEAAARYLKRHGLADAPVIAVPAPMTTHDPTFHSALMVRNWARREGLELEAIDVVSQCPHARRSRLLYQLAFGPQVRVGVLATRVADYDAGRWWRSSAGARDVWDQATGLVW